MDLLKEQIQKWEYDIRYDTPILTSNKRSKIDHLNAMGDDGWELVAWIEDKPSLAYSIFKRPVTILKSNTTEGLT